MHKPDRSTYSPEDFLTWREAGTLTLTPKFQRRGVWTPSARSFFIDTLLRQMPIPPIYIRLVQSEQGDKAIREVVDGQQRIRAVLDFIDNEYRLSKNLAAPWAGKTFSKLAPDERARIRSYGFATESFQAITDAEVLEIFSRLNTYSVPLNRQELRNGRYFGAFKQAAYRLAHRHIEYWRRHGIFSERAIARMLEVELTSELMVAILAGMQDKKKSLDDFYDQNDEAFPQQSAVEKRLVEALDEVEACLGDRLKDLEFRHPYAFYTLCCVVIHRRHGLPEADLDTDKRALTADERLGLAEAVGKLSEIVRQDRAGEPVPSLYVKFVAATAGQTDNLAPRLTRFKTLYRMAFLK